MTLEELHEHLMRTNRLNGLCSEIGNNTNPYNRRKFSFAMKPSRKEIIDHREDGYSETFWGEKYTDRDTYNPFRQTLLLFFIEWMKTEKL